MRLAPRPVHESLSSPPMASPADTPLVERFALGPFATNCYLVRLAHGSEGWIVDASFGPEEMINRARALELDISHILLTHAHGDHIAGVAQVREAFPNARVFLHKAEASWLGDPNLNLSAAFGQPVVVAPADGELTEGQRLSLGSSEWEVMHTPGHSPGMVALHCAAARTVIVGDTLFAGSIGRYDYPTSNERDLAKSLRRLLTLPDETRVMPGHGPSTTIGRERASNPFLKELGV